MGDKAFYATVTEELIAGQIREGLWARALADAGGGEAGARLVYRDLRKAELEATHFSRMAQIRAMEDERQRRIRALEALYSPRMAHIHATKQGHHRRLRAQETNIERYGRNVAAVCITVLVVMGILYVLSSTVSLPTWGLERVKQMSNAGQERLRTP